jgi:hypothetical protein
MEFDGKAAIVLPAHQPAWVETTAEESQRGASVVIAARHEDQARAVEADSIPPTRVTADERRERWY